MEEAGEKLALMETLLEELNLDGSCQKHYDDHRAGLNLDGSCQKQFDAQQRGPSVKLEEDQEEEWVMPFLMEMPDGDME